jgi:hypothetical protein
MTVAALAVQGLALRGKAGALAVVVTSFVAAGGVLFLAFLFLIAGGD